MTTFSTPPVDAGTVAVTELCQAAQAHREYGERHGTLHPEVWQELVESALPLATLPRQFGGLEWSAPQLLAAVREVSAADPAAGWVAAIHGPAGAFLSRLAPSVAQDFAGRRLVVGGSSVPVGTAVRHGERVRLQGCWPLVTGAPSMTLAALAAPVTGPDGVSVTRWWLVPSEAISTEKDWDALGLRGSASYTLSCDTEVPLAHGIDLTGPPVIDAPIFRYPLYALLAGCIAEVARATADRALAAFAELAGGTRTRYGSGPLAEQPVAQAAYGRAHGRVQAAVAFLDSATSVAWSDAMAGEVPTAQVALLRSACCQMVDAAEQVCRELFDAAGSAAIHRRNGLEGCWRDAVVISRHALVAARGRQLVGAHHLTSTAAKDL
ncbi:acyl-CoA dehydrogenase family protein [Nocardia sp. NPDC060256]|uniref:acyl-CoA dehydrogenase family protein n=1 Tax=unclassified Nocardia TaxID=2637762 RepID=UPI0036610F05